jgi:sugar phosphate isomerase/epimerase
MADEAPARPGAPAIQCSTGPFWTFDLRDAFDAVAEAGFTDVELMVTRDPTTQEADIPAELAASRGLRIASVHGPFLTLTKGVWGPDPLGKIRRGVRMCRALGASSLIVHPPYLWERAYARWIRHSAAAYEKATGVIVSVETMFPVWIAGRSLSLYRWVEPRELVRASHRVAMDTSHLTVARKNVLETLALLRPKLSHIHLSDNAGDGRDGHLELGRGVVAVEPLLDELRRSGYAGGLSLELSVRPYLERPTALVEALRRNREYVEDKLSTTKRAKKGHRKR